MSDLTDILLVSRNTLFLDGLCRLLGDEGDMRVVGAAGSVESAVCMMTSECPDVVVISSDLGDAAVAAIPERIPEAAARAMLFGHIQVALANGLRGDNPFSDACLIAMDYGRNKIIKDDWKSIFDDGELDHVLKQMLHLDRINR